MSVQLVNMFVLESRVWTLVIIGPYFKVHLPHVPLSVSSII